MAQENIETKALLLRKLPLSLHWKLEKLASKKKIGKEEAVEAIIKAATKDIKLED